MRCSAMFALLLLLSDCSGSNSGLDRALSLSAGNPNAPVADSINLRRALGQTVDAQQLDAQPGNIWPGPQKSDPTLIDLQRDEGSEAARGFAPTAVPRTTVRGDTDHRQPRPTGSSTPPPNLDAAVPNLTRATGVPPPSSSVPGSGPLGSVVTTPRGPAIDAGGTPRYRQLLTPRGPGAIMLPNGNGTMTILEPGGGVQTVPAPR